MKELKALFGNMYPGNLKYRRLRNSYRIYLFVYLVLFILYLNYNSFGEEPKQGRKAEIVTGDRIPAFSALDQHGKLFDSNSVLGQKNLVIYFYPKDDSPGCTKQACSFRDQFEVFAGAGALIIGISSQSVESHREFAEKYHLTYTLLSDENQKIRKMFGVPANFLGLIPGRVTYIVDRQGKVVYIFNSQVRAEQHVTESLRILKELTQ
jgi:peroxiredoxin Q/BCP